MKPNTQLLHAVWDKTENFRTSQQTNIDKVKFDEIVSSFFCSGPSYFYVVDFFDMSVSLMSPSVKEIHGIEPDKASFEDILNLIHPDDMEYVSQAETTILNMILQIGKEKIVKYKMSYCFRFKVADGSYKLFHHQAIVLTMADDFSVGKSLNIHVDISHLTSENNKKPSLIGLFGEPSYLNVDLVENLEIAKIQKSLFTKRQRQIIKLMVDGFTNKEIGEKLFISVHTVKNHRKTIMLKAGCSNLSQLIVKCISEGLV